VSGVDEYERDVVVEPAAGLPAVRSQSVTLLGTDDPATFLAKARETALSLAVAVHDADYVVDISGRQHVKVEGWTMLGSMLGVFPIVVWTHRLSDPEGWEARVEARTRGGELVGASEAQCTRDETMWSFHPVSRRGAKLTPRDDHALRSMAQTRATRAALRGPLGFIFGLAGFTPDAPQDDSFETGSGRGQQASRPSPRPRPDRPSKAQTDELATLFEELGEDMQPELVETDGSASTVYEDWRAYAKAWCEREFQVDDSTRLAGSQMQALIDHLTEKRIEF
jgi:hypothetical protein